MTFWVHIEADGKAWYAAEKFDPPAPKPVPGRGWPVYFVEFDGFTFRFASLAELAAASPPSHVRFCRQYRQLSVERGTTAGPNSHWLSRMPKGTKSWRYRERAVRYLLEAREDFVRKTHTA